MKTLLLRWPAWWWSSAIDRQRFTRWLVAVEVASEYVVVADVDDEAQARRLAGDEALLKDWLAMQKRDAAWREYQQLRAAEPHSLDRGARAGPSRAKRKNEMSLF
jgi:hypothetical protein